MGQDRTGEEEALFAQKKQSLNYFPLLICEHGNQPVPETFLLRDLQMRYSGFCDEGASPSLAASRVTHFCAPPFLDRESLKTQLCVHAQQIHACFQVPFTLVKEASRSFAINQIWS